MAEIEVPEDDLEDSDELDAELDDVSGGVAHTELKPDLVHKNEMP